jgi:DNA-directed RNA polymerase specialized sigma24 family protein
MATKKLTEEVLLKLRQRMVKHAFMTGHPHPEDVASEYVLRLLEGLHQRSTISQAYIDILRLQTGRKSHSSESTYKARQALTMVASSEEQADFYENQPDVVSSLCIDDKLDLLARLESIRCKRTTYIVMKYLEGYVLREIADQLSLTESRVNQILNRALADLRD